MKKKMVKVGSGDIWVNAANVSFIEDDVVVMSNKHRYKASEEALGVIKAEMAASELRKAEILEVVCKLYADGFTGNKIIKAIGNAVTYNTDAVAEGDLYCVSYRDGGFYVGARDSEDYEPKEGDWWCYSSANTNYEAYSAYIPFSLMKLSYCLGYLKYYDSIVTNWITQPNLQTTKGVWSKLMSDTTPAVYQVVPLRNGIFIDYSEVSTPSYTEDSIVRVNNSFGPKDIIDVNRKPRYTFLFKPISKSDILTYQVTGHMGWLMLSDAVLADTRTGPYSNNIATAYTQNAVDVNARYVLEVRINGQRAHITNAGLNYFYTNSEQVYNIPYKLIDGLVIFNQTAKEYSEANNYDIDNFIKGFYALSTLETASDTDTVTVYEYKVYQDNRPAALNALNTNLLNSNQTDINPINDEENEG